MIPVIKDCYFLYFAVVAAIAGLTILYHRRNKKIEIHIPSIKAGDADPEVIIIGAGIVGSAMAAVLAKDGRRVTVIESDMRESKHFRGEILQLAGVRALKAMGLAKCLEGIDAQKYPGLNLYHLKREVLLQYPECMYGFHHGRFVQALRKTANLHPRVTMIEGTVTTLSKEHGTVVGVDYVQKSTGESKHLRAPLTVITTGCFTRLTKDVIRGKRIKQNKYMGILIKNCHLQNGPLLRLLFGDSGPIHIYEIGEGELRLLSNVPDLATDLAPDPESYFREDIAPQLPDELLEGFLASLETQKIEVVYDNVFHANANSIPGVWCVGDALNSRPAVSASGMMVGLKDLEIARELLRQIPDLYDYHAVTKAAKKFYSSRKFHHASAINMLAKIWSVVLSPRNGAMIRLRNTAFLYKELGEKYVKEVVQVVSGLESSPFAVLLYGTRVALFGVYLCFMGRSWWTVLPDIYNAMRVFLQAIFVIMPPILAELDLF